MEQNLSKGPKNIFQAVAVVQKLDLAGKYDSNAWLFGCILIQFSICGELDQMCLIQKTNYKRTLKVSFFSYPCIYALKH